MTFSHGEAYGAQLRNNMSLTTILGTGTMFDITRGSSPPGDSIQSDTTETWKCQRGSLPSLRLAKQLSMLGRRDDAVPRTRELLIRIKDPDP